jgi:hypothetical protein
MTHTVLHILLIAVLQINVLHSHSPLDETHSVSMACVAVWNLVYMYFRRQVWPSKDMSCTSLNITGQRSLQHSIHFLCTIPSVYGKYEICLHEGVCVSCVCNTSTILTLPASALSSDAMH